MSIPTGQTAQSGKRIEYIDALRGFTMLLVVFHHVVTYCWRIGELHISVNEFLMQVRMPMFFFISGFVLYKSGVVWNGKQVLSFFRKKIPVQLLSPFLFFLVFIHVKDIPFVLAIGQRYKAGYWFTYVLMEYYIIYAIVRFCIRGKWGDLALFLVGSLLYAINWPPLYNAIPIVDPIKEVLSIPKWDYFFYFVLGTLARKNFSLVERVLNTPWFLTCCILFYFLVNVFRGIIPINYEITLRLLSLTGLVVLFSFFRNYQSAVSKERVLGRTLQYVGRRTLDVYLIHFFLLPDQLGFITVFADHPMPVIEATSSLILAIIIVAVCLLIGNIIRLSPFLAHWMFGVKYPSKQSTT